MFICLLLQQSSAEPQLLPRVCQWRRWTHRTTQPSFLPPFYECARVLILAMESTLTLMVWKAALFMRDGDEFHEEFNLHDGDRINLIQLSTSAAMEEGS